MASAAMADAVRPLLRGGRERDVLALLLPYRDGAEVVAGVRLDTVAIGADRIVLGVAAAGGAKGELVLRPRSGPKAFEVASLQAAEPHVRQALQALQSAVDRNDDGSFFAKAAAAPAAVARSGPPRGLTLASWLAWAVLGLAVLAKGLRRPRSWATGLAGGAVLAWAAHARRALPLTLLHADDHGLLEAGMAVGAAEAESNASHLMSEYGPAWWQFQRATVGLFGHDHEALGRWSAAIAAIAVALTAVAARRSSGRWLPALLGAAVMVGAPVAARVGHSESTLVVAQLLIALALWLASPPYPPGSGRWDALGVVAALLLLAWGHPIGPVYAIGTGLAAWALSVRGRPREAIAPAAAASESGNALAIVSADASAAPPPAAASAPPPSPWPSSAALGVLAAGTAAIASGIFWQIASRADMLGARLATRNTVPIPMHFWDFWLWWHTDWGALLASTVLLGLGLLGLYAQRRVHGRMVALWTAAAWSAGIAAVAVAGLLVVACITDGLRYQAPWAPLLALTLAFAPRAADLLADRHQLIGRGVIALTQLLALLEVARSQSGTTALDSQGQAYQLLRRELGEEREAVVLIAPERPAGTRRHVVVGMPVGRWQARGPDVEVLQDVEYRRRCVEGRAPPAWVYLPPACEAVDLPEAGTPCAALDPLLDVQRGVRAGYVRPMSPLSPSGLRGEFHDFPRDLLGWRLGRARCPSESKR